MRPNLKTPAQKPAKPKRRSGGRPSLKEAEQLQGRILDAAAELFVRQGYGETSIDAIAAHAGIGKLTLYRRFADKEALFRAVFMRLFQQWRTAMAELGDSEGNLSDVLTAIGRRMLDIALSPLSLALHRTLFAEAARLPELCAQMDKGTQFEQQDPIRAAFRRFVDRGQLRVDDVAFLDHQFIQAIIGKPLRRALLGAPPMTAAEREEHVRKAVDLFVRGVETVPKSPRRS
jgi:TetR/AcrR family transcriptional repressor of mexJK operon